MSDTLFGVPQFWTNNMGQNGIIDLGDLGNIYGFIYKKLSLNTLNPSQQTQYQNPYTLK